MKRTLLCLLCLIQAILILSACNTTTTETVVQCPTERLLGSWSQLFGFVCDENMFNPFESGVGELHFSDDGTGYHVEAWDDIVTYFTWHVNDEILTVSDGIGNWNGNLRIDIYEHWEIVIEWFGAPDWVHVNSAWGLQQRRN